MGHCHHGWRLSVRASAQIAFERGLQLHSARSRASLDRQQWVGTSSILRTMHHHLRSSPETVHWGWFDAALPHVLTIESGDRVTIESLSGGPANLPGEGFH